MLTIPGPVRQYPMMNKRLVVCALALLLPLAASAQPADDARFVADTRDYLQRLEKLGFSGVVLIARNGTPLLAEGYGIADRERNIPWTPATVSCIGSITKQFTAAAILKLAEEGRLRVDDTLAKHFEGVPEDKRAITLHQLLTHSSGIVDLVGAGDWDPIGREEFVKRIFAQPLAFAPGSRYDYSNAGYSLLGAIIEKLSGMSYERHMRERFFVPLGLYETGYILAPWGKDRLAQGYRDAEHWGTTLGRPMAEDGPYWVLRANGGIHLPAWDMLRWTRALLEGRVLSDASRKAMWEPHVREGENADTFYGYGWSVQEHGGMKVLTHNGSNGVFYADLALVPDSGTVIYLMTNVFSGNGYIRRMLEQIGYRLLAGRAYPEVPRVVAADPAQIAALAGEWTLEGGGRLRATAEKDALVVEPLDPAAFGRLFSTTAQDDADRKLAAGRGQQLLTVLRAVIARDFAPLARLYGAPITVEEVTKNWTRRLNEYAERNGTIRDAELIGVARRGDEHFLVVRVRGERGTQDLTFVWQGAPTGRLLGMTNALPTRLRFQPEAGGGWAAFDRRSGESVPLRVEGGRLVVGRGEGAVRGIR